MYFVQKKAFQAIISTFKTFYLYSRIAETRSSLYTLFTIYTQTA
jgi:hypothetical protein